MTQAIRDCLVDAELVSMNPRDVAAFLTSFSGVTVLIDGAADQAVDLDKPVTVAWRNLPLLDAVSALAGTYGLEWHITEEAVVLLSPQRCTWTKAAMDRYIELSHPSAKDWEQILDVGVGDKAKSLRISVEFESASFYAVLDYVREITAINFCISHTNIEDPGPGVSVSLRDALLSSVLDEICNKSGHEWWIDADTIQVAQKGRRPAKVHYANAETARIDVVAESATPAEIVDLLRAARLRVDVHGDLPTRSARIDLRGVLVRSAMDWICTEFELAHEITAEGVVVRGAER